MKFLLLSCVFLSISFCEVTSQTVSCETIEDYYWTLSLGELKTCYMKKTTTIDSDEFVVSSADLAVRAINFYYNKKIQFLPLRVSETFPNLVVYFAGRCSIKALSKKNFRNLKKLKELHLHYNLLERINTDTFEDLTSLESLSLENNKINQINGATFTGLISLKEVWLVKNLCIDKDYKSPTEIASLYREVNTSCGFAELEEKLENLSYQVSALQAEKENLKARLQAAEVKIATQQNSTQALKRLFQTLGEL